MLGLVSVGRGVPGHGKPGMLTPSGQMYVLADVIRISSVKLCCPDTVVHRCVQRKPVCRQTRQTCCANACRDGQLNTVHSCSRKIPGQEEQQGVCNAPYGQKRTDVAGRSASDSATAHAPHTHTPKKRNVHANAINDAEH